MAKKSKSKRKRKEQYLAVAVLVDKQGKGGTLSAYGSTRDRAIANVVKKAAKYGTIASLAVYKGPKQLLYVEYPIISRLRAKAAKKEETGESGKKKNVVRRVVSRSMNILGWW